jgi:phage replication O-like protein O
VILRKTYGWHKKQDRISLSQFSQLTGLKRQNVLRAINNLSSKKIIGVIKNDVSQINIYNINKDFDEWQPLPKKITLSSKKITTVINIDNRVSSKKIHTKEKITKETIQKKIYGEFQNVKFSDLELQKLKESFGDAGTNDRIENLSQYMASLGKKYLSHYATILAWERKNNGTIKGSYGKSNKDKCSKYDGIGTTVET